jgi:hypothetical protein
MCRAIRQDIYQFFKSLFLYLSSGDRGQGLKSSTLLEARISNEHAGSLSSWHILLAPLLRCQLGPLLKGTLKRTF